jgi:uncharacterized protein YndB with AHSA1/START domain
VTEERSPRGHVASAEAVVEAPQEDVWRALVDPDAIRQYMFGSVVTTDWRPGSTITWSGEYDGHPYEDRGEVLSVEPPERLVVTHWSPLSGVPDEPANYHTLDYRLEAVAGGTRVRLEQDGNDSAEQAEQFSGNWAAMLAALKKHVESSRP